MIESPLFEDNHLLVLNKPAGLLTQPSGTQQESLEQQAKDWLKETYHKPGQVFLEAVHRLDKPVSGVVLFGKTSKALTRLNASIRAKNTRKIYWAWVEGIVIPDSGQLQHYMTHDHFYAKVVSKEHSEAKLALLNYRVLQRRKSRTLLEIELLTGRYHQIRLQLSTFGYPIWGDLKYGAKNTYENDVIALHHYQLQIPHPISQSEMIFQAESSPAFIHLNENS